MQVFWRYFVGRVQSLKDPITENEAAAIERDLARLPSEGIFVLRHGDIEDYLPPGVPEMKAIVDMVVDRNWINRIAQEDRRVELGEIVCGILGVAERQRIDFVSQLRAAAVDFPVPLSKASGEVVQAQQTDAVATDDPEQYGN